MLKFVTIAALLGTTAATSAMPPGTAVRVDDPAKVQGAIYVPSEAYNAPQMWKNFSAAETDRDFGYANKVHVNALRVWASYEYWRTDPAKFQTNFNRFLDIARKHDIRILISLFEENGEAPTPQNMWAADPVHGVCVQSPGDRIAKGPEAGWEEPRQFVAWFMQHYRNDSRLIAIEVFNEPRGDARGTSVPFAQSMLKTAASMRGTVPLTIGSAQVGQYKQFLPLGLDIVQFHQNFPKDAAQMKREITEAMAIGRQTGKPVWLTEWQRIRPTADGFGQKGIPEAERGPDAGSLGPTVNAYPIGTFFWSLMVKRAYLRPQRTKGTVNGLFWPDGSVVSLNDARAVANDRNVRFRVKPLTPAFGMEAVRAPAGG